MNIVVLNGSPKGDLSITLQYIRYAAKKKPAACVSVFSGGSKYPETRKG